MNLSLDKRSDRIFILGCGNSCMPDGLLDFLKNEYVIAVSQWALLADKYPFDFYFLNDNYRWTGDVKKSMFEFFQTDHVKWAKSIPPIKAGECGNDESFINEFSALGYTFGKHTYGAVPFKKNTMYDEEFLMNGKMSCENPQTYFTDAHFSKYKIQRTGYGSVVRCAVDLAYFLRFKKCYILNLDVVPIIGNSYNDYINSVSPGGSITEEKICTVKGGGYRSSVFFDWLWEHRFKIFAERGFDVKRVVTSSTHLYETSFLNGNKFKVENSLLKEYENRHQYFKTILYEDLINGNEELINKNYRWM